MAQIQPFKALRPDPQHAAHVASRPYDVMNRAEAKEEARGNPYSFLHITRSEVDLPESVDVYDEEVYNTAKNTLKSFISRNVLFKESKPCYYIYQLVMDGRTQTGLVCVSSVDDYNKGIIKKHEFTRPEKENDRINHMVTTCAQTGNVFLAYRDTPEVDRLITNWQNDRSPVYDFTAPDGVRHSIWVVNTDQVIAAITEAFTQQVPATYIADGHHRAASAAKAREKLTAERSKMKAGWFLTTLFPASQLSIFDYNRVITDLNGHSAESILQALSEHFAVEVKGEKPFKPQQAAEFGMYVGGTWYALRFRHSLQGRDPVSVLDISLMQEFILSPLFNIHDQRTDKRIDFVGGIRGLQALADRVDSGEASVAFSLYPVSMEQLFAVADTGEVMPPKSTWFEPKLRDGLLTYQL